MSISVSIEIITKGIYRTLILIPCNIAGAEVQGKRQLKKGMQTALSSTVHSLRRSVRTQEV